MTEKRDQFEYNGEKDRSNAQSNRRIEVDSPFEREEEQDADTDSNEG